MPSKLTGAFALLWVSVVGTPAVGSTVFALVDTGELHASTDQGVSWSVRSVLPVSDAVGLIAGRTSQRLFLASATGTVYLSLTGGNDWSAVGSIPASDIADLQIRSNGDLLALTRSGTVWHSTDDGASFSASGILTASNLVSLGVGPNGRLYALTATGEVQESVDQGVTWTVVGAMPVSDAVELRGFRDGLYVLTRTGLTYESLDAGVSWTPVGTVSQVGMAGLTQGDTRLLAVTREGEVARSSDGTSWNWVGAVNQLTVTALGNDLPYGVGVPDDDGGVVHLVLAPPSPNPLRAGDGAVLLRFELAEGTRVAVDLFDVQGRRVAHRAPQNFEDEGEHSIRWPLGDLGAGSYFLRVTTSTGGTRVARLTVLP